VCDGNRIFVNNDAVPPFESLIKDFKADRDADGKLTPDEFPDPSFKQAIRAIDRSYGNGDGAVDKAEWDGALKLMQTLNTLVAVQINDGEPKELWRTTKKMADASAPLIYQGVLYLIRDGGILSALDCETGEILEQKRITNFVGRIFASPVAAAGNIYIANESGKVAVVRAEAPWHVEAINDLEEKCYATPALVDGVVFIRSEHSLWAFRQK
jgi:hypothetical protein